MATNNRIRKGNDIMVFVCGEAEGTYKSVAFATNHTLSLSLETDDLQTKDNGYNGAVIPKRITWEITSENLYIDGEYTELFQYMIRKKPVYLRWGNVEDEGADKTKAEKGIADGDSYDETKFYAADAAYWYGKAYITSLTANANAGENATFSVTFTGSGDFNYSNN